MWVSSGIKTFFCLYCIAGPFWSLKTHFCKIPQLPEIGLYTITCYSVVKVVWLSSGHRPPPDSWTDYTVNKLGYCWEFRCIIEDITETEDHSMVRALSCATSKLSHWVYLLECFCKTKLTYDSGFIAVVYIILIFTLTTSYKCFQPIQMPNRDYFNLQCIVNYCKTKYWI